MKKGGRCDENGRADNRIKKAKAQRKKEKMRTERREEKGVGWGDRRQTKREEAGDTRRRGERERGGEGAWARVGFREPCPLHLEKTRSRNGRRRDVRKVSLEGRGRRNGGDGRSFPALQTDRNGTGLGVAGSLRHTRIHKGSEITLRAPRGHREGTEEDPDWTEIQGTLYTLRSASLLYNHFNTVIHNQNLSIKKYRRLN